MKLEITHISRQTRTIDRPAFTSAASIKPNHIEFLLAPLLAIGHVTVIVDATAASTSMLTSFLATKTVNGSRLECDQVSNIPRDVVIAARKSSIENSIVPQLGMAGANLTRIKFVNGKSGKPGVRYSNIAQCCKHLVRGIRQDQFLPDLAIIEAVAEGSKTELEEMLSGELLQVKRIARHWDLAIVIVLPIANLGNGQSAKNVTRKIASIREAGAVAVITKDDGSDWSNVTAFKNFAGVGPVNFKFRTDLITLPTGATVPNIHWEGLGSKPQVCSPTATKSSLRAKATPARVSKQQRAVDFIQKELAGGGVVGTKLIERGKAEGHTHMTLRRACDALGVIKQRDTWSLPS